MAADSDQPLKLVPAVEAPVAEAAAPAVIKAAPVDLPVAATTATSPAPRKARSVKAAKVAKTVPAPVSAPAAIKPAAIKPTSPKAKPIKAKPIKAGAAKPARTVKTSPTTPSQAATGSSPLPSSKDKTMASTAFDMTTAFKTAFEDMSEKAKAAYEKSTSAMTDVNEFAKGNVEAVVESSKILASGLQEMGTTVVEESRAAFETMTAEVKNLAAAKSPTEFFQLQSALLRKHFDAAVAQTSKSTEAMLKLANESMAPISNRVTIAVEKVSKVA